MPYYKNIAFNIPTTLFKTGLIVTNPTVVAGDAQLSIDGAAFSSLTPTVTPTGGDQVIVPVTAAQNSGVGGQVILKDPEATWEPVSFSWVNDDRVLDSGTAQAGAASTITLRSGASATDNLYNHGIIEIIAGTGAGQSRQVTGYVGSTKVATVAVAWATQPTSSSVYLIHPGMRVLTSAETQAEAAAALAAYDPPTHAELILEINAVQADIAALDVIPAASAPDAVIGGNVSRTRGTSWSFSLTGLGSLAAYTAVVLTVKREEGQADAAALLQVYNHVTTGLIRFNGAAPRVSGEWPDCH